MFEVIVGMLFTFLLLSLLGTTLNELISAWRGWRGYYLEEGLKRLLEYKDDPTTFEKFRNNPFYKQLTQHKAPLRVSTAPAYLSSANFSAILTNVLKKKDKAAKKAEDFLDNLPENSQLRQVLDQIKEEGHETTEAFKARLQTWFDDVMNQASGWYKRHLQFITLFIGLGIAAVLNADSFQIYSHLTTNTAARQRLNAVANKFMGENEVLPAPTTAKDSLSIQEIKTEVKNFINSETFTETANILGLGWDKSDIFVSPLAWLRRLLGWFITALAISLGAPFWFDVLKKIITIKSTGTSGSGSSSGTAQVIIQTGKEPSEKGK
jgi:hypothetical protein